MNKNIVWIIVFLILLNSVTAFSINLDSPSDNAWLNNQEITFLFTPNTANITECCLIINSTIKACNQDMVPNSQNSFISTLNDGTYTWNVNCSYENNSYTGTKRQFNLDTIKPVITIVKPSISSWNSGIITVVHSEQDFNLDKCYYNYNGNSWQSISCNQNFEFDTTKCIEGTNSCVLQIKATDKAGNENTVLVAFSVDNKAPTAAISLSDSSPVKEGTIEVTLQASEDLRDSPILEYSLDNTPNIRQPISLTGSGSLWHGYMIIPAYGNRIGTFYFKGFDIAGNNGSLITDGKLFLIDTLKPVAPKSIKLIRESDGDIKIEWYYDGEPYDHIVIYRSTDDTINYVDEYDTTENGYYVDTDVNDDKTYYYRISAVDKAGNNGDLSAIISINPEEKEVIQEQEEQPQQEQPIETPQPAQPKDTTPKESEILIKDLLNEINRLSVDISWVISNFQNKEDVVEKHLITDLELTVTASNAQLDVEELRKQLLELQSSTETEALKMKQLNMIELRIKKIMQTTPKNIIIREKNEFIQSITEDDIKNAIDELVGENKNLTLWAKNNYKDDAILIQTPVNVNTEVDVFTLEYLDKTKLNKTVVNKKLAYHSPDNLYDVVLVEVIPKNVVYSVNDMEITTADYEVLKEDPVLLWRFSKFNYEEKQIKYIINKEVDIGRIKGIKSVILKDPSLFLVEGESTKISGFSIFSFGDKEGMLGKTVSISAIIGFIIVIILSGYYFVFIKGFSTSEIPLVKRFTQSNALKKQIKETINEANDYIEIEDYERARSLYPKIKHIYNKLPPNEKSQFYDKCLDLYSKIIDINKK